MPLSRLPTKCKHCKARFTPEERAKGMRLHIECFGPFAQAAAAKIEKVREAERRKRERADRVETRKRKEKLKTVSQWEKECRDIIQKMARIRDRHDGCISCHMGPEYRGLWHGSHFRPAGNHSAVELHLWNVHKSCAQCNLHKGGNIAAYRPRLIEKIGLERVEWLEAQNGVTKRTKDYLKRFRAVMGKRLRRMEKRAQEELG